MAASMIVFYGLAALLVLCALAVVFQRNVVHCAIALVAALFLIAIFFLTLQAAMVAVLQILVYAGAVMVLFLFVIMFLNPAGSEPRAGRWWAFAVLGAVLLTGALAALVRLEEPVPDPVAATDLFGSPETLAKSLFTDFVLPFELASILLLVAIVGAVVLAKRDPH